MIQSHLKKQWGKGFSKLMIRDMFFDQVAQGNC